MTPMEQEEFTLPMPEVDERPPSDHLLRTLAAVPVSSQILDLGCGRGHHTEALLRLGFPVHACDPRPAAVEATRETVANLIGQESAETAVQVTPLDAVDYPEGTFDWVVADQAEVYVTEASDLRTLFEESRRLLKPGGWLYVTLPVESRDDRKEDPSIQFSEDVLERHRKAAELAEASGPSQIDGPYTTRIQAIYRRVEPHMPG